MQNTQTNDQQLTSSAKEPSQLALHENNAAQSKLDEMIAGCFLLQKLYGRQPENIATVNQLFHSILGNYPGGKVVRAFSLWLERSQEFPTPADIVGLIRRNGKPPLRESDIIAIRKKDGQDRTRADWAMLTEWDAQQQDGWKELDDPKKDAATLQENIRLRQEVKQLREEVTRLGTMLRQPAPSPAPLSQQEKIDRTVKHMRETGAPQEQIDAFLFGVPA